MSELPDTNPPDPGSTDDLLAEVYDELRSIAASFLRQELPDHTLQPTAVVHEAWLRLNQLREMAWRDRAHFAAAASGTIRRILVDHARSHAALKRGGSFGRITLSAVSSIDTGEPIDMIALDDALQKLAAIDERKKQVVELRFFGGLTIAEAARELDVGTTTIEDDWAFARAWLHRELCATGERDQPHGTG